MPIKVLSEQLAAQIAAGEVIERPASVVKELIENAVDAGAREIRVEVRDGGKRLIRVADNGSGIPAAEVELAFVHHATSKLSSADDLFAISTLGFRGEALPSIAAVSQLTLLTQAMGEDVGTELKLSGGRVTSREPRGTPQGTVLSVENLFHNIPARLKFLKSTATESSHIHELVNRYALAYPQIRFHLISEGRTLFQTAGNGSMADVLIAVFGIEAARQMVEVGQATPQGTTGVPSESLEGLSLHGFVSTPALTRANRSQVVFFVNGRVVQDRSLAFAVSEAYHTLLPVGRYPVSILLITLPAGEVDVNVHPTKAEVRFRDARQVFSFVQRAVRATLMSHQPVPTVDASHGWPTSVERQASLRALGGSGTIAGLSWDTPEQGVFGAGRYGQADVRQIETESDNYRLIAPAADVTESDNTRHAVTADQGHAPNERLPMLRVLGQVARTYIIAEGPEGIFLIDQHAAHERVLYEKLVRARRTAGPEMPVSQALLEPLAVELSPQQAARLEDQLGLLDEVGFAVEPFGSTTYLIRGIPPILAEGDPRKALVTILDEMADEREWQEAEAGGPLKSRREAVLIASVCKQSAIKAGRLMSLPEMQELIHQLELSESPRTCPHGRPTVVRLGLEQLAREFRRT